LLDLSGPLNREGRATWREGGKGKKRKGKGGIGKGGVGLTPGKKFLLAPVLQFITILVHRW